QTMVYAGEGPRPSLGNKMAASSTTTPTTIRSRPVTALAWYHICSSAKVAGIRKPYQRFRGTRRLASGTPRTTDKAPIATGTSCSRIMVRLAEDHHGNGHSETPNHTQSRAGPAAGAEPVGQGRRPAIWERPRAGNPATAGR